MDEFSSILKKLRQKKQITQKDLGQKLGFSERTIASYEQKKRLPNIDTICKLARFFDVSTDYLLGITKYPLSIKEHTKNKIPAVILINQKTGRILSCNPGNASFFNFNDKQMIDKSIYENEFHNKEIILKELKKLKYNKNHTFFISQPDNKTNQSYIKVTGSLLQIKDNKLICLLVTNCNIQKYNNNMCHELNDSLLSSLSAMLKYKNPFKADHHKHVAQLAVAIAKEKQFPLKKINNIKIAALLHDLGELAIPESILNKPDDLTEAEYNLIKEHPHYSYNHLRNNGLDKSICEIIYQHHEKVNGSGYPHKLKSYQIKIEAKIISVADTLKAMITTRPYRPAHSLNYALTEISSKANIHYDTDIVKTCIKLFKDKNFTFK